MKRIIFLLGIILLSCLAVKAQDPVLVWNYATPTTPLGRDLPSGALILVRSTGSIYQLTIAFKATNTPAGILTDGHYIPYPKSAGGVTSITPPTNGTGYVGTTSLRFGTGFINIFTAGTSITSPSVTASTTLTLPGATTITKTSGDGNSATKSGSLNVTDTLNAQTAVFRGNATITGTMTATALPYFDVSAGTCPHEGATALDTCGLVVPGLTTNSFAMCTYATLMTTAPDTNCVVYSYKTNYLTFQGKYKKSIKYWIPKK